MNLQTPVPTAEIQKMPDHIVPIWQTVFPETFPAHVPTPTPTPDAWMQTFTESIKETVPPDFPLQIRDMLTRFRGIATEVYIPWYLNAPFDILMHFLLGAFLGLLAYLLTWGILSTVELHLAEHLPGGNSANAARDLGIRFFSGLFAACVALGSHLWWDGYSLLPSKAGNWLFWIAVIGSISVITFLVGWMVAPKDD